MLSLEADNEAGREFLDVYDEVRKEVESAKSKTLKPSRRTQSE
jgi:hypothetical protein